MSESKQIDCFTFQKEETYEAAKKEKMVIDAIRQKYDVKNKRVALKIYQKAIKDNSFSTVIGYSFLAELYRNMEQAKVPVNDLPCLPLKEKDEEHTGKGHLPAVTREKEEKWKILYQAQKTFNKKCKIVIAMLVILIAALFVIEYKSQDSIFTYKEKTEQELIDKYETWEEELQERENALNGGNTNGTEDSGR